MWWVQERSQPAGNTHRVERPYEARPLGVKVIVTLCVLSLLSLLLDYLWFNLLGDEVAREVFASFGMAFTLKSGLVAIVNGIGAFCLLRMKPNGEIFFALAIMLSYCLWVPSVPLPYSLVGYVDNSWGHYYAWPLSLVVSLAFAVYARRLIGALRAKAMAIPAGF